MTTPSQTELDKAIESCEEQIAVCNSDTYPKHFAKRWHEGISTATAHALLLAAKRSKELERERDELARQVTLNRENWRMEVESKDRQLSTLTTAYKEREKENTTLVQTLCFFASVIKSGEPWTGTCQNRLDEALNIKEL